MTSTILVTGAHGFIGQYVCKSLTLQQYSIRPVVRRATGLSTNETIVSDINGASDWSDCLDGVDAVIHLAARVHIRRETAPNPFSAFRSVNTEGTLHLARAAANAGVKRFIFVSTLAVHGRTSPMETPFTETSPIAPHTAYGQSKWEAEQNLWEVAESTGLQVVIVRPPLVYGWGAPGNFGQLVRWIGRGVPLPLGRTSNLRSLLFVKNLADFLVCCVSVPQAADETFLLSDGEDLSTTDLLRRLARAMGVAPILVPVPERVIRPFIRLIGKERLLDQLWGSLRVDSSKARQKLKWQPPFSVDEGLKQSLSQPLNRSA